MRYFVVFLVFVVLLAVAGVAIFGFVLPKQRRVVTEEFSACESRFNAGQYQDAAQLSEAFIKAHQRNKKAAETYYFLAKSKQKLGDYPGAMAAWEKIITKYPKSKNIAEAYYYSGSGDEKNKQYIKAMENYKIVVDKYADAPIAAGAFLGIGKINEINGQEKEAAIAYQNVIEKYPDSEFVMDAERRSGKITLKNFLEENTKPYEVKKGESLVAIAKKLHTTPALLMKINNFTNNAVNVRQTIRVIDASSYNILIDKTRCTLSFKSGNKAIKRYYVCVGKKETPTPAGDYKVTDKMIDPTWFSTTSTGGKGVIPSGDPRNELGTRWIGFMPAYGIHGTIFPDSIGKAESHGCVRMLKEDVEELYDLVSEGTPVKIVP